MADFIGWMTDIFDLSFTIGTVTVTLGYLAVAALIVNFGLSAVKKLRGR